MYANGFRYYFTPLPGYFSPFPHGTCPLSVFWEYLGLTGGPARFTRNFRGSVLLGVLLQSLRHTSTGLSPATAPLSNGLRLQPQVSYSVHARQNVLNNPTTPHLQPLPGITQAWFGLIRFRSPLLSESLLFSLPVGTEMFHFPTFPLSALYIQAEVTRSYCYAWRGFPIRRSSDQSSIISSPRLIADLYVLLRLQKPRHSPFALRNLMTKLHKEPATQ